MTSTYIELPKLIIQPIIPNIYLEYAFIGLFLITLLLARFVRFKHLFVLISTVTGIGFTIGGIFFAFFSFILILPLSLVIKFVKKREDLGGLDIKGFEKEKDIDIGDFGKEEKLDIIPTALIIGGGISGMTAALNIADQGFKAFLVEKEDDLGGNLKNLNILYPIQQQASVILEDTINKVKALSKNGKKGKDVLRDYIANYNKINNTNYKNISDFNNNKLLLNLIKLAEDTPPAEMG